MAKKPIKPDGVLYVNPVSCLNYETGHDHQYTLSVNISSAKVDPITGALDENASKEYVLDAVCRHCSDRVHIYRKTVGLTENVTMAQMLEEYRANLKAQYEASKQESQTIGGR